MTPTERMRWAREQVAPTPLGKAILLVLMAHSDQDGRCHVAQATIAREAQCSERAIRDHVPQLIEAGLVEVIESGGRRSAGVGRGRPATRYRLGIYRQGVPESSEDELPAPGAANGAITGKSRTNYRHPVPPKGLEGVEQYCSTGITAENAEPQRHGDHVSALSMALYGRPAPPRATRADVEAAAADIADVGCPATAIAAVVEHLRRRWDDARMVTPRAVARHLPAVWRELAEPDAPNVDTPAVGRRMRYMRLATQLGEPALEWPTEADLERLEALHRASIPDAGSGADVGTVVAGVAAAMRGEQ